MLNDVFTNCARLSLLCGLVGLAACDSEVDDPELIDDSALEADAPDPEFVAYEAEDDQIELLVADDLDDLEPILALETQDPDDLYIESISTGGTGCPDPYTVTPIIASDRKSFLLIFDDMHLAYSQGYATVQNITCSAGIKLHVPSGYQVALATVNTRGYAYLDKGIRARHTSKYFFAGDPIAFSPHATLKGPFDDLYDFTDYVPFESLVWSPCGGSAIFGIQSILNLNAIFNPHGQALFSNDTVDGKFQQLYHLKYKKCYD